MLVVFGDEEVQEGFLEMVIPELNIEGKRQGFQKQRTNDAAMKNKQLLLSIWVWERE